MYNQEQRDKIKDIILLSLGNDLTKYGLKMADVHAMTLALTEAGFAQQTEKVIPLPGIGRYYCGKPDGYTRVYDITRYRYEVVERLKKEDIICVEDLSQEGQ